MGKPSIKVVTAILVFTLPSIFYAIYAYKVSQYLDLVHKIIENRLKSLTKPHHNQRCQNDSYYFNCSLKSMR